MFSSPLKHTDTPVSSPLAIDAKVQGMSAQNGVTIIARGVKLEGDFTSKGDVVIDGEVRGKVIASGTLTVGNEAVIHADVAADNAVISGLVEGNVTVKTQVVLHATARVTGDLTAGQMAMELGATLEGHVQVGLKQPSASAPLTSAEKPAETVEESKTA